jgi:putative membrane protein
MGTSWWLLGRNRKDGKALRFMWGRLIRDSASEVLPLSQVGGFVSGARALTLSGVAGPFSAASTVVDMSVELVSKLPYIFFGLALLNVQRPQTPLILPLTIGVLFLVVSAAVFLSLQERGAGLGDHIWLKLVRRWPSAASQDSSSMRQSLRDIRAARTSVGLAFLVHLTSWLLGGVETWLTLRLMGQPIDLGSAMAIDSLVSTLRSAAFFVPNAVGVQEGASIMLGGLFGVSPSTALALSLVKRGRDWAIGVPALLAWHLTEWHRARLALAGHAPGA